MTERLYFKDNPEERRELKRKIIREMRELAETAPEPQEDWDLVWVMSGPPIDIAEDFAQDRALEDIVLDMGDEIASKDAEKKVNESKERLETGLKVAREITAKRLDKEADEVTIDDILEHGPNIYWNATDKSNDNLRQRIESGFFEEKYKFPGEKIIVSPNSGIKHTGHQFERFPQDLADNSRKLVLVSDIYHLPRVLRYLEKDDSVVDVEKVVLYPSLPKKVPVGKALSETRKIPEYIDKDILPEEK